MTVTSSDSSISTLTKTIVDDTKKNFAAAVTNFLIGGSEFPSENILHQYRTFNYNVTLAIISPSEYNSGSYKRTGFDYIVFQSSGKPGISQASTNGSIAILNKLASVVNKIGNAVDPSWNFILQELYIQSAFTPKRDIGLKFRMKILEPYGVDTLLTTILEGIRLKGYTDFQRGNAFVLKVEFVGWRDDKEEPEVIPYSTRYYPLMIESLTANVTQEGTVYQFSGIPWTDIGGLSDTNQPGWAFKIQGNTVGELFESLVKKLNDVEKTTKEKMGLIPNQYAIEFVDSASSIATAKFFDPTNDTGAKEFLQNKDPYVLGMTKEKSQGAADGNSAELQKITIPVDVTIGISKVIDNIIVDSYYVVDMMKDNFQKYRGTNTVPWWRVVKNTEMLQTDPKTGTEAKKIIYKIIPRDVSFSKIAKMFDPTVQTEAQDYESRCVRKYEWLYTGNNRDILSFKINYNQLFTQILTANLGRPSAQPGQNDGTKTEVQPSPRLQGGNGGGQNGATVTPNNATQPGANGTTARSPLETNPLFGIARDVNSMINNPFENIMFEMEILGDPMWLGTEFVDNQMSATGGAMYTPDGGIALRSKDPNVRVISYSPQDFNQEGFLTAQTGTASKWSAYYVVTNIESFFQGGVFKQKLTGYRQTKADLSNISKTWDPFGLRK